MSERERFEAWWRDFWIVKASTNALELAFTKLAWDAWQAALADRPEQDFRLHGAGAVHEFANLILHGDDKHRAWLMEAANAWSDGRPMPKPTSADRPEQPVALNGWRLVPEEMTPDMAEAAHDKVIHGPFTVWRAVLAAAPVARPEPAQTAELENHISHVVQRICEIPYRFSPDDQPEMMLVTAKELSHFLREEFGR